MGMKLVNAKTVRFARIVEACGTPELVSLWSAPEKDKQFMAAVKAHRVMTVKQPSVGSAKDFGIVGFHPEKDAAYLKFPKPLTNYENQRVIGINYDLVKDTVNLAAGIGLSRPGTEKPQRRSVAQEKRHAVDSEAVARSDVEKIFQVRIRYTAEIELEKEIQAKSKTFARRIALNQKPSLDFMKAKITPKIVHVRQIRK
jgi:hypothetical protein